MFVYEKHPRKATETMNPEQKAQKYDCSRVEEKSETMGQEFRAVSHGKKQE